MVSFQLQAAAETAYDVVSPDSPVKRGQNRLAQQPADLREGVTNAYQVFREVSSTMCVFCLFSVFVCHASTFKSWQDLSREPSLIALRRGYMSEFLLARVMRFF